MDTSVIDLPAPVAARLRRPGWRDPRLLAGVAMVAASVLLGSWAVRTAQATVPVYVTRAALVPGDRRHGGGPRGRRRPAGHGQPRPLPARRPAGRRRRRGASVPSVAASSCPRRRSGSSADLDLRPVSVTLTRAPVERRGAAARSWTCGSPLPRPRRTPSRRSRSELAGGLTVAEVSTPSGAFGASGGSAVQVLVPSVAAPRDPHGARGRGHGRRRPGPGHGGLTWLSGCSVPSRGPRRRSSSRPSSRRADG